MKFWVLTQNPNVTLHTIKVKDNAQWITLIPRLAGTVEERAIEWILHSEHSECGYKPWGSSNTGTPARANALGSFS